MLKVKIQNNKVVSFMQVDYIEKFVDLNDTDNPVIDSKT